MRNWIQQAGIILFVIGATSFVVSSPTFQQQTTTEPIDVERRDEVKPEKRQETEKKPTQKEDTDEKVKEQAPSEKDAEEQTPPTKDDEAIVALQKEVEQLKKELATKEQSNETPEVATVKKADAKIVLDVENGVSSPDIAAILKEAKMIDDEKAFNDFLIEEGYATKIRPGTYEIDYSMDPHTIGRIITHQQ